MKKLFRKIYNAITLNDLEEEIKCLEGDIKDLQRSTEDQEEQLMVNEYILNYSKRTLSIWIECG